MLNLKTNFIFLVVSFSCFITTQAQDQTQQDSILYLRFCKKEKMMEKKSYTKKGEAIRNFYLYHINYKKIDYGKIEFIENDLNNKDTLSISSLKSKEVKDYKWLKTYFLKNFDYFKGENPYINKDGTARFFNLNRLFKKIYIVQIDSTTNQAIISKVYHDQYEY